MQIETIIHGIRHFGNNRSHDDMSCHKRDYLPGDHVVTNVIGRP